MLFRASSHALFAAAINGGKGAEFSGFGFLILSPLIGLFLVLSVSAGLVVSHILHRRSAHGPPGS
jgi:hypothetical protein